MSKTSPLSHWKRCYEDHLECAQKKIAELKDDHWHQFSRWNSEVLKTDELIELVKALAQRLREIDAALAPNFPKEYAGPTFGEQLKDVEDKIAHIEKRGRA